MATRSSILAWNIPWAEEPGGLQSVGSERDTTEHMCHAKSHSLLGLLLIKLPFPSNANI